MTTLHAKALWVNTSNTALTTSSGYTTDNPNFFYRDQVILHWNINDANGDGIDLTGGTFRFKMAGQYDSELLIDVTTFNLSDWVSSDITQGKICCRLDFNTNTIKTFLDGEKEQSALCSLWMTKSGVDYCLVSFSCKIRNIIF
jgi:hypothetical protein